MALIASSLVLAFFPGGVRAAAPPAFTLGQGTRATGLTTGPDGSLWFGGPKFAYTRFDNVVGRVTPNGEVGEFWLDGSQTVLRGGGIVTGPDGALWFADTSANAIRRVAIDGRIATFPLNPGTSQPGAVVVGPDGALWFTEAHDRIGRIDLAGSIKEFYLSPGARPTGIAAGRDGALWITEPGLSRIARLSPSGALTEFPLPEIGSLPGAIVVGPDGALWFTEEAMSRIGRIGLDGAIREFSVPAGEGTREIAAGPGGNIWFSTSNEVGSMSPTGATGGLACVPAGCGFTVGSLATGPEGQLWYGTGFPRTEGGGGSALLALYAPGLVGRFEPPPLAVRIGPRAGRVRGDVTTVRVDCDGGVAGETCAGHLRLTAKVPRSSLGSGGSTKVVLARRSYRLAPASGRRIALRLGVAAAELISRRGQLAVTATAFLGVDPAASRRVVLHTRQSH